MHNAPAAPVSTNSFVQSSETRRRRCSRGRQYDVRVFIAITRAVSPGIASCELTHLQRTPIDVEVWRLGPEAFGRFVAAIPAPLGVGTIELEDGSAAKGFLVETAGLADASDISAYGGWRNFISRDQKYG